MNLMLAIFCSSLLIYLRFELEIKLIVIDYELS